VAGGSGAWCTFLRWLHDLQKIEHEKALAGDVQQFVYKKTRSFGILPLCSFDANHVTVDTTVLHGLLKRVTKRTRVAQAREAARLRGQQASSLGPELRPRQGVGRRGKHGAAHLHGVDQ
jgi:hypothetical protein